MKYIDFFARLILPLYCLQIAACEQASPSQKWLDTVTQQIQSQYSEFADTSGVLVQAVTDYCQHKVAQKASLERSQQAWRSAMDAWQRVQWVQFGPISDNNDAWKIQFWPDKKNIVARKINGFLKSESAIDVAAVADASVVIQGLSALELLLFDDQYGLLVDDEMAVRRCQLTEAISLRLQNTTSKLAAGWQDQSFLDDWFSGSNDTAEVAVTRDGEIVDAMLGHLEQVKLDKLGDPLGIKNRSKRANGYFAESWRSGHSLTNIRNNLGTIQRFMASDQHYDLMDYLNDRDHQDLAQRLESQLTGIITQLNQIDTPLKEAVNDAKKYADLVEIHKALGELNGLLKRELAPALGVTLGFNANDGD